MASSLECFSGLELGTSCGHALLSTGLLWPARRRRAQPAAKQASQPPVKPLGHEPISQKRKDVPQSGRAVPECPVEEFGKRRVGSLLGRARSDDTQTEAAIGTPGDDRLHAVEPSERTRPRRRPTRIGRPLLFEIKDDQYLRHGFDSAPRPVSTGAIGTPNRHEGSRR